MFLNFEEIYFHYKKYIETNLKPQSIRTVKDRIEKHILPYFKNKNIYDIKEIDILNWHYEIQKENYSYKYQKTLHTCLVTFLNFCIKYFELKKNVASNVGNFKNYNFIKREYCYYSFEEFEIFIRCIENEIYKQFFNFLFFTGVRPGEAMALKFSDLNDSIISINKTISERNINGSRYIGTPKNFSSIRDIEIDTKLNLDLLKLKKYYQEKYKNDYYDYFIFGGIKPLAPTTINKKKKKACELANLKEIRLHDFRHSHATLLLDNNMYIKEVSRRLGHSNTSTTLNIYIHTKKEHEKRVIETLNSLR